MSNCSHAANEPCVSACDPVPCIKNVCCETVEIPHTPICDMTVSTICCPAENRSMFDVPDDVNGDNICPCAPCPETLLFSVEQKDFMRKAFDSLLTMLIPAPMCGCVPMQATGHMFPIRPPSTPRLNAAGQPTGLFDAAGNCCGPNYKDSPFIGNGGYRNRYAQQGGRPSPFTDMDAQVGSAVYYEKLAKLICCTRDSVLGGDIGIITPI
jgi:hypothetical protein